jgi:hypothetical protein
MVAGGQSKDLRIRYVGDTSGVKKAVGEIDAAHQGMASKMAAVGSKMQSAGRGLTMGLTLPLAAAGVASFKAASDLGESMSKVKVVFGDASDAVVKWSEDSATAFGMSQQQALEAVGTYGNLFSAFGVGAQESGKMSKSLVGLAADLASFNNASPEETLLAIRSGLSGETEPLKRFGIALSAARIEEEAVALGLMKVGGELSNAAKSQAAYSLIMKDSTLAQGDFARTADGAANQQRILRAELSNAAAEIGSALLPVGLKLTEWVRGLIGWFANLSPEAKRMVAIIGAIAAAVGPLLIILGKLATAISAIQKVMQASALANPWLLLAVAVVAVVALIIANWDKVKKFVLPVLNTIKDVALAVWDAIKAAAVAVWDAIGGAVKAAWAIISTIAKAYWTVWSGIFKAVWAVAKVVWKAIATVVKVVWAVIRGIATAYLAVWRGAFQVVAAVARVVWAAIKKVVGAVWAVIRGIALAYKAVWTGIFNAVKAVASGAWNGIKAAVSTVWGALKNIGNTMLGFFRGIWNTIKDTARTAWNGVKDIVTGVWDTAREAGRSAFNAVAGFWNSTVGSLSFRVPDWVPLIGGKGWDVPDIPLLERGGRILGSGLAIVGERGPELVSLRPGATVAPLGNASAGGNRLHVTLDRRHFDRQMELAYMSGRMG